MDVERRRELFEGDAISAEEEGFLRGYFEDDDNNDDGAVLNYD